MGIVNVTPDSFSDGGVHDDTERALEGCARLIADGADLLDIGPESTRPGAPERPAADQIARVDPVIRGIRERWPDIPVSIDTRSAQVARASIEAGAVIVNDVSGLSHDPAMRSTVAELGVPAIVMHMRGTPADMLERCDYDDVVAEVLTEQRVALDLARDAGVEHVIADPGIGFAKTAEQSLALLAALHRFAALDVPLLVGPSRKSFLRPFTGETETEPPPPPAESRRDATIAAATLCAWLGAHIVRVHDVASCRAALRLVDGVRSSTD